MRPAGIFSARSRGSKPRTRLAAKIAEAQAKVNELAFVSERLRVENRGPQGLPGPMGRDEVMTDLEAKPAFVGKGARPGHAFALGRTMPNLARHRS